MGKSLLGKKWKLAGQFSTSQTKPDTEDIVKLLLGNRNLNSPEEQKNFLNPIFPDQIKLSEIGIDPKEVNKAIKRIKKAIKNKEKIIIYGDYDADGICSTAIMWETLHDLGADVLPHIPNRFDEGYGLNFQSIKNLKSKMPDLKLIITVDNGISACEATKKVKKLGIDVIVTDHHEKADKIPEALAIIHTTKTCGSVVAWFVANEISSTFKGGTSLSVSPRAEGFKGSLNAKLELAAIGTIADQILLVDVNRSIVKFGLEELNKTKRPGLLSLFLESGIMPGEINTYTVGFLIAPRINAMGRLAQGIDSLRLLCTKNAKRAKDLSLAMSSTNRERQKIVEEVSLHAKRVVESAKDNGFIVVAHETYHEGVIGLAASKLVEEFWRPAIVFSKGKEISKASARSIPGVNIIEIVRSFSGIIAGGGHEMAAGFSIRTVDIELFNKKLSSLSPRYLKKDILVKTLKIDAEINFGQIDTKLLKKINQFEPFGSGNPTPTFLTKMIEIIDIKPVGQEAKHLKMRLRQNGKIINAIAFGLGRFYKNILEAGKINAVYNIEENKWNGKKSLELKIKDIKL